MSKPPARIDGVVPIIPTPFREDQTIDYAAVAACVRFAAESGVSAVCLPAYGSEFYKLSESERGQLLETAINAADGKVLVLAQSNHPAAIHVIEIAQANEARGADLISFAVPRIFSLPEADLLEYCRAVCSSVSIPVLVQDFNPNGITIGPDFCRQLADACPNFRYVKLEEPLMAPKVAAIRQATEDRVGVLEGWGGMYLLELVEPGICGVMPGLGMAELFQEVWRLAKAGSHSEAMDLFEKLLPHVVFSLQNMELFLWMEKDLLARRGVIPEASRHVRKSTYTPDAAFRRHAQMLNDRVVSLVKRRARK